MSQDLKRLLMADAPAARDARFEIAVLARIEQRRFRRGLAANMALAAAATLLLALVMPGLQPLWTAGLAMSSRMLPHFTNLGIGIALMIVTLALQVGFPLSRE